MNWREVKTWAISVRCNDYAEHSKNYSIAAFKSALQRKIRTQINTSNIGIVPSRMAMIPLSKDLAAIANNVKGKAELKNPTAE